MNMAVVQFEQLPFLTFNRVLTIAFYSQNHYH